MAVPCPCTRGLFNIPLDPSSLELVSCKMCEHPLLQHEQFESGTVNATTQSGSTPSQYHLSQTTGKAYVLFRLPLLTISLAVLPQNPVPRDANDARKLTTDRDFTVQALWNRLQEFAVVHIRGTPASGKSTLAYLLQKYVERTSDTLVFSFSWSLHFPNGLGTHSPYFSLLNSISNRPLHLNDWFDQRKVIIIDEAQGSYQYMSLWNDLIKFLAPDKGVYVALFTPYGSPSGHPVGNLTPTPVMFSPTQRVSIWRSRANSEIGLCFSRQEFDDVIRRVSRYHGQHGQQLLLSRELTDYIWHITVGHASAVQSLLDGLACSDVRAL